MEKGKAETSSGQWKLVSGREEVLREIRKELKARMRTSVMGIIRELFEDRTFWTIWWSGAWR